MNNYYYEEEKLEGQSYESWVQMQVGAVLDHLVEQGVPRSKAYKMAGDIRIEYEEYYMYANGVNAVQRHIDYDLLLSYKPTYNSMTKTEQKFMLWQHGWDTFKYKFSTMTRLTVSDGKRSLKKVLYGWERSDNTWLTMRDNDYTFYSSLEARLVNDAKRYG